VVVHAVPDHSTVVGIPGRVVKSRAAQGMLEHGMLPDPEAQEMNELKLRVEHLEAQLRKLLEPPPAV